MRLAVGDQGAAYGSVWDVDARAALNVTLHASRAGPAPRVQVGRRSVLAPPRQAAGRPAHGQQELDVGRSKVLVPGPQGLHPPRPGAHRLGDLPVGHPAARLLAHDPRRLRLVELFRHLDPAAADLPPLAPRLGNARAHRHSASGTPASAPPSAPPVPDHGASGHAPPRQDTIISTGPPPLRFHAHAGGGVHYHWIALAWG